jgi:hypothetical protein
MNMNTKAEKLDKHVKAYILANIDASSYGIDTYLTDAQKVKFLFDTFMAEYGWQIERLGQAGALREWFAGLPSSCSIAFYNHEILKLAADWGSLDGFAGKKLEAREQLILDNWFNLLANKTSQLFRKFKVAA